MILMEVGLADKQNDMIRNCVHRCHLMPLSDVSAPHDGHHQQMQLMGKTELLLEKRVSLAWSKALLLILIGKVKNQRAPTAWISFYKGDHIHVVNRDDHHAHAFHGKKDIQADDIVVGVGQVVGGDALPQLVQELSVQ